MEVLYAELHDKYDRLKARKITEVEISFQDQEEKFTNYVKLADKLIKGLRSEYESVLGEMCSIRSSCDDYQRLLTEEREKRMELLKEVERLQVVLQERGSSPMMEHIVSTGTRNQNPEIVQFGSPGDTGVSSEGGVTQLAESQPYATYRQNSPETISEKNSHGGPLCDEDQDHQLPNSTIGNPVSTGECRSADFLLLTLLQSLAGLKLSIVHEAEKTFLSAVHQASGYSFRISFIKMAGNTELLYEVVSLGTIVRMAQDWMKENIVFGVTMFPVFMKQISTVLDL